VGSPPNLTPSDAIGGDDQRVNDDAIAAEDLPIEIFLERYPPPIRATALRLRELIRIAVPDAVEGIRSGWSWIGYGLPDRRAKRTFGWIGPERKHIHLGFQNGVLLADPDHRLHGAEERLKQFRYFTFERETEIEDEVVIDFLRRAADLAVMPSSARRALAGGSLEAVEAD
jgi:hypothetical protein